MKKLLLSGVLAYGWLSFALAQGYDVAYRHQEIILDGHLGEWQSVRAIELSPSAAGVNRTGAFGEQDLSVQVRFLWDEKGLYAAVHWQDDGWDVSRVRRQEAVFVTSDRRRRDRMLFFDYLKLQFRELNFDYLLWVSPRVNDQGPYFWHRRLMGVSVREMATRDPVITPREHEDGSVTLEMLLEWKELELKYKKVRKKGLPVTLLVADSDRPGAVMESKLGELKHLEWNGRVRLMGK